MGKITVEEKSYSTWGKCVRISNGAVELYATTEIGPRIIRFGTIGGPNIFFENTERNIGKFESGMDFFGKGEKWYIYGGHRLWHAPETFPRTDLPDNYPVKYELTEKPLQKRLYKGDQIVLGTGAGDVIVTVAETTQSLALETPAGVQHIDLSEEIEVDVDGDSTPEMIVYVSELSKNDKDRGAEVRIVLKSSANAAMGETKTSEIPNAEELPQNQKRTVILEDTRAYPFTIRADFRAGCVFRYRPDRKETTEDFFTNGDTVNMTASNGVRMWISNGNTVKLQVIANGKTYDLGLTKAGQVVVQDIRWIKDTDGKYKLVVSELD